ncbi:uncharacterized protein EI97DRAFT_458911 [Westerdykella ornata]|uniref:Membrane-associated proteins in eicosanoid and glutathione metabolism n=1 Tax=Westerdykella ornata TaxID=318751 RepID=A0A6A6JIJ2_WESOR|nr:uncharacterized protein EI97DRAFT_458911 [Westerdykella ornata]KAF2275913.1 hypothetical protein EI97DRAFT_458911 [Westerdykella ornata]
MTPNLSLYAIPAYWLLALYPHAYAITLVKRANNNKWNNANPRGTSTTNTYQKCVPEATFARFERAEAAHKNLMENAPFVVGAVAVGNWAGLGSGTLNTVLGTYLALRVLYVAFYINVTSNKYSYLRTLVWTASTTLLMGLFVKAGNKIAFA